MSDTDPATTPIDASDDPAAPPKNPDVVSDPSTDPRAEGGQQEDQPSEVDG